MTKKYLKIKKCDDSLLWYREKVGEIILLEREDEDFFWIREGGFYNCINIVKKTDAVVIEIPE